MNSIAKLSVTAIAVALLGTACSSATSPSGNAGSSPVSKSGNRIGVQLKEFSVTPSASTVQSGAVTFSVTNTGKIEHEFVIIRTSDAPGALPVHGAKASEAGHVDEIGGIVPGTTGSLTVDLTPGHYVLICNLPGHYQAGMDAGFSVA